MLFPLLYSNNSPFQEFQHQFAVSLLGPVCCQPPVLSSVAGEGPSQLLMFSPFAAKTKKLFRSSAAASPLLKLKVIREGEKLVCPPSEPWQGSLL